MSEQRILNPPAEALPGLPVDEGEPAFFEPWQAKAFALTVSLNEAGFFAWSEWTEAFAAVLAATDAPMAEARTAAYAEAYYRSWLDALEQLIGRHKVADAAELNFIAQTWKRAAEATRHGTPIRYEAGLP
ncbi:nitrile hydratase accessory protein [Xanthobacter dioxanivorans]|uniref:Nitrile hydratase accessory protein n=1 Tax=Xanthobacter dioxanivorans TaxID=2528964 RepID=A0A974SLV6_9HYPH|nr:nitrile hydratase accessory protein [Xanthobacter dioxanivorans]QRG08948.1 nitrile hydratase accessory protein [Xanthobacter dioxanivorans]